MHRGLEEDGYVRQAHFLVPSYKFYSIELKSTLIKLFIPIIYTEIIFLAGNQLYEL